MLGIDVSKDTLSVSLLHPLTHKLQWEETLPNTKADVQLLLEHTSCDTPWVVEPTGRYSLRVARQAKAAQRLVLLAPPRRAKAFLASIQSRAKNDRLDSCGLALYALSVPLRPYPIKSDAIEQLDQLLAARRGIAQAIVSLGQQKAELPYAAAALLPALKALKTQQKSIDKSIAALTSHNEMSPLVAALDGVPGIGPVTAAAVASALTSKEFAHPDAFVAYVGLDVRARDSGRRKGKRGLSKQGAPELRRLLFLAASASLNSKVNPFVSQYNKEQAKGLTKTAALNAVARKLARMCWSIARHGATFDPDRVYQQPGKSKDVNPSP